MGTVAGMATTAKAKTRPKRGKARKRYRHMTVQVRAKIVRELRGGAPLAVAAAAAGVHEDTLTNWRADGRKAKAGIKHDFYLETEEARRHWERTMFAKADKVAKGDLPAVSRTVTKTREENGEQVFVETTTTEETAVNLTYLRWRMAVGRRDEYSNAAIESRVDEADDKPGDFDDLDDDDDGDNAD